jgi:hypothetical protein
MNMISKSGAINKLVSKSPAKPGIHVHTAKLIPWE